MGMQGGVGAGFGMAVMECKGKASLGRMCNGVAVMERRGLEV